MTTNTRDQIIFEQSEILQKELIEKLKTEIITKNKKNPKFFQFLIIDFIGKLTKLNFESLRYAGSLNNGDIDAIFQSDIFGFNKFYVNASIRNQLITEKELQNFAASFSDSPHGIFITLSDFEPTIKTSASNHYTIDNKKILLMNKSLFLEKLIYHNIGVKTIQTYEIKDINHDFFDNYFENMNKIWRDITKVHK